jgi:hypothetical protein
MAGEKQENLDGGPRTALFSFDLEREQEIARRYTPRGKDELLALRLMLAEAVMRYRQDGQLTGALLDLCEQEAALAGHWNSFGYKRLGQLAADGHAGALARLNGLLSSSRSLVRKASFVVAATQAFEQPQLLQLAKTMLADKSAAVRSAIAEEAVFRNWFELAPDIMASMRTASTAKARKDILFSWMHLTDNERTGVRSLYSYVGDDRWAAAQAEFLPQS